ncbi:hypothetical protein L3X38_015931 [Prunus dulcis]|uniref:Uncharacterized protein n=1 Tax=Prunus dulcis TaxID=3755 RepID=A0AAD4W4G2_PRUDU|nr:hypothetical protein L3X38_015931 [Prunus dulcis]
MLVDVAKSNNTFETTVAGVEKIEKFFGELSFFNFFIKPVFCGFTNFSSFTLYLFSISHHCPSLVAGFTMRYGNSGSKLREEAA